MQKFNLYTLSMYKSSTHAHVTTFVNENDVFLTH